MLFPCTLLAGRIDQCIGNGEQDALIIGKIVEYKDNMYFVNVEKVLMGEMESTDIKVEKPNPDLSSYAVGQYFVLPLDKKDAVYKIKFMAFMTDSTDYKTLKLEHSRPDTYVGRLQKFINDGKFIEADRKAKEKKIKNHNPTTQINIKQEAEKDYIKDSFFQSVSYNPVKDLLSFTIPKTIPEGYRFYLHVSGRMYMGNKSNGMSFHAFDKESTNYSWEKGKTYTYALKSENLDECLLVFGFIDKNNREILYSIHISPNGTKSIESTD